MLKYQILSCWLLLHGGVTGLTLLWRETMALEWSIILLFCYSVIVLILQRKQILPIPAKRLPWAVLAYVVFISLGGIFYGIQLAFDKTQRENISFEHHMMVPVENPGYLSLMVLSIIVSFVLGIIGCRSAWVQKVPDESVVTTVDA
jgi:hypothetical protein